MAPKDSNALKVGNLKSSKTEMQIKPKQCQAAKPQYNYRYVGYSNGSYRAIGAFIRYN